MPTHTPAPWVLDDLGDEWDLVTKTEHPHGATWIAKIISGYDGDEANAKLIASAPELLDALKKCQKYIKRVSGESLGSEVDFANYDLLDEVETVIEKAK